MRRWLNVKTNVNEATRCESATYEYELKIERNEKKINTIIEMKQNDDDGGDDSSGGGSDGVKCSLFL